MQKLCPLLFFILEIAGTQFNIQRENPFKQLSKSLQTFHVEECDGDVVSLICPQGTKVTCRYFCEEILPNRFRYLLCLPTMAHGQVKV